MKVIETLNDLEFLKACNIIPMDLIKKIEKEFICLYESAGSGEDLFQFRLPYQQAIILLEESDDVLAMFDSVFDLEYVERNDESETKFYRIVKRFDHEYQLIYTLVGIHNETTEKWLLEHSEWTNGDY